MKALAARAPRYRNRLEGKKGDRFIFRQLC
jgi:hypothetical protein